MHLRCYACFLHGLQVDVREGQVPPFEPDRVKETAPLDLVADGDGAAAVDADRDEAEEIYGDYVDVVEAATEALADMRWRYASTLDETSAEEYEAAFNRAVQKRWPPLGLEIDNR